jgi:hypothetical protein
VSFRKLRLRGPGTPTQAANGITFSGGVPSNLVFDSIKLSFIYGRAWYENGASPFKVSVHGGLDITAIDAGDVNAIFSFDGGNLKTFDGVYAAGNSDQSSADAALVDCEGGWAEFGGITTGKAIGPMIRVDGGHVNTGMLHWEPQTSLNSTPQQLVSVVNGYANVRSVKLLDGTLDHVYETASFAEGGYFGPVENVGATINTSEVRMALGAPNGPVEYNGPLSEVTDSTGATLSEPNTVYASDGPKTG